MSFSNKSNRYIDLDGTIKPMTTLFDAADISEQTHAASDIFYMGVADSKDITIFKNKSNNSVYALASHGASHIVFVACYDSNKQFVKLIKSRKWFNLRYLDNVKYCRTVVYGKPGAFNEGGCWPVTNVNFHLQYNGLQGCVNCECNNVYWHDTRSTALHPSTTSGMLFKNCTWKDIAITEENNQKITMYNVTTKFGDFEEGNWEIKNVTLDSCNLLKSPSKNGRSSIGFNPSGTFNMINCTGISLEANYEKNQGGIIRGCTMPQHADGFCKDYENAHKVFKFNTVNSYTNGAYETNYKYSSETNAYLYVFNKIKVEKIIPMIDCEFTEAPIYNNLKLTRVKCGNNIIDN